MPAVLPSRERSATTPGQLSRRAVIAGPLVAGVTLIGAIWATREGRAVRDPDNVAAKYLVLVGLGVLVMWLLDIVVRAAHRTPTGWPSRETLREVRRERWSWKRCLAAACALVSFYVSYLAYRNLKSMVPLLRPDDLFDRELADLDRVFFAGQDPWELLHSLLGTGISATPCRSSTWRSSSSCRCRWRSRSCSPAIFHRPVLHDGALAELAAGRADLPAGPRPRADLRVPRGLQRPARHQGRRTAADPDERPPGVPARSR